MDLKVLSLDDGPSLVALEKKLLDQDLASFEEQELLSWSAPWRKESLEHYLPLGWSFGLWNKEELVAYALAQPLLFFQCHTQSLWVEHISCCLPIKQEESKKETSVIFQEMISSLVLSLYGWARTKHLQNLIISLPNKSRDLDCSKEKDHSSLIQFCIEKEIKGYSSEETKKIIILKTTKYMSGV